MCFKRFLTFRMFNFISVQIQHLMLQY